MALFHTTVLDNQIKALPTVDTASGSIATFDTDLTENLVSVKCQIVAKQASGTPSPVNPLPIQTYDSLTLYHNDINIWDEQWENGIYNASTGLPEPNANRIRSKNPIRVIPNTTYYVKSPTTYGKFVVVFFDANDSYLGATGAIINTTFTTPNNCAFIKFNNATNNVTTYNHDISINYPSTDTQYHAFNGAYIPFGQTVANGVLDITTGKLRVTHVFSQHTWGEFSNKHSLGSNTRGGIYVTSEGMAITNNNTDICNIAPYIYNYSLDTTHFYLENNGSTSALTMFLPNDTSNDTVIQVCYKLETPIEIQLDSITLQALLNENNIWCDTGDTEVKYLLTVGKKIS